MLVVHNAGNNSDNISMKVVANNLIVNKYGNSFIVQYFKLNHSSNILLSFV